MILFPNLVHNLDAVYWTPSKTKSKKNNSLIQSNVFLVAELSLLVKKTDLLFKSILMMIILNIYINMKLLKMRSLEGTYI